MKTRSAWVFQRGSTWNVGWYEPDGSRRSKSFGSSKTKANQYCTRKSAELLDGVSDGYCSKPWQTFVDAFRDRKLSLVRLGCQAVYNNALEHFERICEPARTTDLTTEAIDKYISTRLKEGGKTGSKTSASTINKELRVLRLVANIAKDWKYLREAPKFAWQKESERDPTFVSQEQFELLYRACNAAVRPVVSNVDTADWWRAFLVFASMTGWRVGEILKLTRDDLDLKNGYAITRAKDNKGKKTVKVPLHPIVVEHLEQIKGFTAEVFSWPHEETAIYDQLHLIQDKAGVTKQCTKDHEHTDSCKYFGFHDFRRGFASINAGNLSASELQSMMRHQSDHEVAIRRF
jgi:integrase